MALIRSAAFLLIALILSAFALNNPFPVGYSMGNLGTVLWADAMSGNQPWISAAYATDSLQLTFQTSLISYYDEMSNLQDRPLYQISGGASINTHFLNCKISISHLNAFDTYFDQSAFLSVAFTRIPFVHIGLECTGNRSGLSGIDNKIHTTATLGCTGALHVKYAAVVFRADNICVKNSRSGGIAPLFFTQLGVHTIRNRFGAQGITIRYIPDDLSPISFSVGELFYPVPWFNIQAAFTNNPVQISIGLAVEIKNNCVEAALVNHPELGWSKGIFMGIGKKKI